MAYPTISAPYGLKPINLIGGQPYAGSTRLMHIKSGVTNAIYFGDLVRRDTDGTIIRVTPGATLPDTGVAGVFMGCTYVNAQGQQIYAQYCPAGLTVTSGTIQGYVVDDPDALFKVAVVSSGTTVTGFQYTDIGLNAALVNNGGSNTTGDSAVSVFATNAQGNASTLPLRVIAVVPDTAATATTFREVVVKFNNHQYNVTTGLDYTA